VREMYRLGIVHADLSEFNIMVEEGRCIFIDWPQFTETGHPNAEAILGRDIDNILGYFQRKYQLEYDREDVLRCVTG